MSCVNVVEGITELGKPEKFSVIWTINNFQYFNYNSLRKYIHSPYFSNAGFEWYAELGKYPNPPNYREEYWNLAFYEKNPDICEIDFDGNVSIKLSYNNGEGFVQLEGNPDAKFLIPNIGYFANFSLQQFQNEDFMRASAIKIQMDFSIFQLVQNVKYLTEDNKIPKLSLAEVVNE